LPSLWQNYSCYKTPHNPQSQRKIRKTYGALARVKGQFERRIQNFCICFLLSNKGIIPIEILIRFVKERQCGLWKKNSTLQLIYKEDERKYN